MEMFEGEMANYFDEAIMDYKEGSGRMQERLPEVAQGYFDFTEACFAEGAISKKHKQLVAIAISLYAHDEFCIMFHTKAAVELGMSEEEFLETIAVSTALGGGGAFSKGVTLAMDSFDYYSESAKQKNE